MLYIDHVSVSTTHFEDTLRDYLSLPGARLQKGPAFDNVRHANYAFVRLQEGTVIEVLDMPGDSPALDNIQHGGGASHLCYAVADIEASVSAAVSAQATLIAPPTPAPRHDNRPVALLVHPSHGLVELVAALPANFSVNTQIPKAGAPPARLAADTTLRRELAGVFGTILPHIPTAELEQAEHGITERWDSLVQLQIAMAAEQHFGIRIPMAMIAELSSFRAWLNYIIEQKN